MKPHFLSWFQSKTARKYLSSYLLISILPAVCICLFYCLGTRASLVRQAEESMQTQLEQLKNDLDANMTFMETSAGHLSGLLSGKEDAALDQQAADLLIQQLNTYRDGFRIESDLIYFPRGGTTLITPDGNFSYYDFQKNGQFCDQLDMVQYYVRLNSAKNRQFFTTRRLDSDAAGDYLIYLSPVPNLAASPLGTLSFLIKKESFDGIVRDYCGDFGGYLLMYDTSYGLSYSFDQCGQYDIDEVSKTLRLPQGGVAEIEIEGENFVSLRTVSKNYGFTYLYAIPSKVFYAPIDQQLRLFIVLSVALVCILLMAAIFTTVNTLKPLFQLSTDLLRNGRSGKTDLFEEIRNQYRETVNQNNNLQLQVQSQNNFSRQRILSELLYGWRDSKENLPNALKQVGISFLYNDFFVITLRIEGCEDPLETMVQAFEQVRASDRQFWSIYLLHTNQPDTAALLFNLDKQESVRQMAAETIRNALLEAGNTRVKLGVGGFRNHPCSINASYCEALVALQDGTSTTVIFEKSEPTSDNYLCPQLEGKVLQQSLLNGSEENAVDSFHRMVAAATKHQPPFHIARCFCFYIVSLLLQTKSTLGSYLPEEELIDAANHMELSQFGATVGTLIQSICRQRTDCRRADEERQLTELLDYINRNFGDYSLSVELLAEHFSMPEKTVRQLLREQTGSSLTAYLTSLRMNYIKQKLIESDIPVRQLIAEVGYADVSSFTRKFRELEGVTPGQYRTMMRKEEK